MEDMEDKIGAILSNPQMMQQIMAMAQSLGGASGPPGEQSQPQSAPAPSASIPDPAMLGKLVGLAGQSSIDRNQQALLNALGPYLSRQRIGKLEKAMRAAKMANLASVFLSQGGLQALTGR